MFSLTQTEALIYSCYASPGTSIVGSTVRSSVCKFEGFMSEIAKNEQSRCAKGFESGINSKNIELSSLCMVRVWLAQVYLWWPNSFQCVNDG